MPHRLTWTWSTYGTFFISEKYTYSRPRNRFLPPHKWWAVFFIGGSPSRPISHMVRIGEIRGFCNISMLHAIRSAFLGRN